jgi:hypothetical protein
MKDIKLYTQSRTDLIDSLIAELETKVTKAQEKVYRELLAQVVDKLQVKDGKVTNSALNRGLLNTIDTVFNSVGIKAGIEVANTVINAVDSLIGFNADYFSGTLDTNVTPIDAAIRNQMGDWLGITDGKLKANGYLDKIVKDDSIRNAVKDLTIKNVISQNGFAETRKQMQDFMVGKDADSLGKMQQYYRNMVYDTYSVADRLVGLQYADNKGLNFAIYEGGIIKTTRPFCHARNGKVFHREEIAQFNPPTAKPPNYNPFTDLGGYACRHHLNWISDKLARRYREDALDYEVKNLIGKAKEAGAEVDSIAQKIAKENKGVVTPMNYKGYDSMMRKVNTELNGNVNEVKDAARTTIIVDENKIGSVLSALKKDANVVRIKNQTADKFDGYSGNIVNLVTANGTVAEIQVNTAKMIFAKEKPDDARRILGDGVWNKISNDTGMEGGLGHSYYEQMRVLNKATQAAEYNRLKALSIKYYSAFR